MSNDPDVIRIDSLKICNGVVSAVLLETKTPFLIGVAGGTASGKSTVCKRIMEQLGQVDMDHAERQVVCISQDSFYRELDGTERAKAEKGLFNFDHPSAFNETQLLEVLQDILAGKKVVIPLYDYKNNAQCPDDKMTIYPADVVLFEGILAFYFPAIRDLFHMKLFVDTDSDTRLSRRVVRDITERGRDLEQILTQYMTFVKPAFEEFCSPTKKFADVIIPRGADNTVAIELIVQHIRDFLNNRGRCIEQECNRERTNEIRENTGGSPTTSNHDHKETMEVYSHPFMNNRQPLDIPSEHSEAVERVYKWTQENPNFPPFSKNHTILFLHACYWDIEAAKKALQQYVTIRASAPDLFDDRDPMLNKIQLIFNVAQMISMPTKTKEGYEILIYRLTNTDPSKIFFADALKGFCMFNDIRLSEDLLAAGYVVIFDMKGVRLGHVSRVQLGPLKSFMSYIQEAHPARLKKIYICHAAAFVNQVMSLVKPLIKSDLMSLLHFTTKGPQTIFDKELLPIEYQGTSYSCDDLYREQRKRMETIYREWLIDSAKFKEKSKGKHVGDKESKRNSSPPIHSFNALEID